MAGSSFLENRQPYPYNTVHRTDKLKVLRRDNAQQALSKQRDCFEQ
jgi:hypothetical protein